MRPADLTVAAGSGAPSASSTLAPASPPRHATSFFEYWPGWLFYLPVAIHWLLLGIRHGSLTLPTAANPAITAGGLCGESKSAILDLIEGEARAAIAPYAMFDVGEDPVASAAAAHAAITGAGLSYPLVIKPDIGCNGTGVRKLADAADLARYLGDLPRPLPEPSLRMMLQAFIPYEGEAGLFYIRDPGATRGRLTSVTLKMPPAVTGDGRRSLRALILDDPRLGRANQLFLPRLAERLDHVPASGERVQLAFVGNHCKGSLFRDGRAHATPELADAVEHIARSIPGFTFGRVDLRYRSLAELRQGKGFAMIEVNGVGSEATHIWDPDTSLWHAYATQFAHYGAAFRNARANRSRGVRPTDAVTLFRLWRRQRRLLAAYPTHD